MRCPTILVLSALLVVLPARIAFAQTAKAEPVEIRIGYLRAYEPQLALSVLDGAPRDEGVAGANVAIADNNTTGKFMGQEFALDVSEVKPDADVVAAFRDMVARGDR
ncbi:MAG: branched-chain amino acid ABC transporter substrate-binding protein, partial [Pseudomonadota bacterium]|nr:branched-chain amino acid ABC transporter substrate-binding protein [Pseudomonadota bacterium]